jgi:hypothetical protein
MRARSLAPALAAALLLAACSVDVEGAPCTKPWVASGECPDGQACGNDLRCSTRAFACAASRDAHCVPGAGSECVGVQVDPDTVHNASRHCTASDPVCGRWVVDDCTARDGMVCGQRDAAAALCECPDPDVDTSVLVADAVQGSPDASRAPFPRGVGPPQCRFASLWDALAATTVFGIAPAKVVAMDGVFVDTRVPLLVKQQVTLAAADPAHPPTLRGSPGAGSAPLFEVQGVLDGFRVLGGGAPGIGVQVACRGRVPVSAFGVPEVRNVSLDGGGILDLGIVVGTLPDGSTGCGGVVQGASVTGVARDALRLEPETWGTARVQGGSFGGSGVGIHATRGTMTIDPDPATSAVVRVAANAGVGVLVDNLHVAAVLDVTLNGLDVSANGGPGIAAGNNAFPAAAKVRIRASDVHGNGKATAAADGGILFPVSATSIAIFELSGTRVWSNAGDQVAIAASPTAAVGLPSASCDATANWIGCAGTNASIANLRSTPTLNVYGTFFSLPVSGDVSGTSCAGTFPAAPVCE